MGFETYQLLTPFHSILVRGAPITRRIYVLFVRPSSLKVMPTL